MSVYLHDCYSPEQVAVYQAELSKRMRDLRPLVLILVVLVVLLFGSFPDEVDRFGIHGITLLLLSILTMFICAYVLSPVRMTKQT